MTKSKDMSKLIASLEKANSSTDKHMLTGAEWMNISRKVIVIQPITFVKYSIEKKLNNGLNLQRKSI